MHKDIDKPNWTELYTIWKQACDRINSSIISSPKIMEIDVDSPGWDWYGNEYIDWWPNDELDSRKKSIEKHGIRGLYMWEKTKVGTRTTAELLWNLRNDSEGMALTWIGASMWDKGKNLPESWRGEMAARISFLLSETIRGLRNRNLWTWHHSSRDALPITLHNNWIVNEAIIPSSYEHLVGIASIESVLTHSNWTIVRIVAP